MQAESTDTGVRERLKDTMARQRLSVKELSERASMPYRTLQNYLLGTTRLPASAATLLAEALGTSTDWLLKGEGATFDKSIVADYLRVIEDIRSLSKNSTSFEECAEVFSRLYNDEYRIRRGVWSTDPHRRHLEAGLAELRQIRD